MTATTPGCSTSRRSRAATNRLDELTLALDIDDKLLRDLLRGLYYPESSYAFSAISADILGQVYERFLGKVIRLTEGHRAVVNEKPEVRKAGGVYYRPLMSWTTVTADAGEACRRQDSQTSGRAPRAQSGLRFRVLPPRGFSSSCSTGIWTGMPAMIKPSGPEAADQGSTKRAAAGGTDDRRAQADSAKQHLWRGH